MSEFAGSESSVRLWEEPAIIPTYLPPAAEKNPMFIENRVYQGSSGRVYPNAITDRVSDVKRDVAWRAIHLENEFLYLMVLPEIGGRIHVGRDRTNGYDFFYHQHVIKPALVGLLGPWISGGVEFNWPQHHRPTTFMPTDVKLQEHADGSKTAWLSEHEPMNRMKGMHGVCLHPGKSFVELKVQLYNRTSLVQTFLWWANVAARVHEMYQSFFPPDVNFVADHAKRATSLFPLCDGLYYGVDYGKRGKNGVPAGERPRDFVPLGDYPANDLSWYANIPVPTSYMAMGSGEDFFGGYDYRADAGVLHIANHHISPGKKQWTWGNHEFGYAWDRELTDSDGPYIELMAGVYTDNQPDFSFLHPFETRKFSQFWYPIRKIGPAKHANLDAAVNLEEGRVGVCVTSVMEGARVIVSREQGAILDRRVDLAPGEPFVDLIDLPEGSAKLRVLARDGRPIIEYFERNRKRRSEPPAPAMEPPIPKDVETNEQLYLIGLHLEQYRHVTRLPEMYWKEAVERDWNDVRCNNALGRLQLRRGMFAIALDCFQRAIRRITQLNPNPYDGEPYYNLGLAWRHLENFEQAYDAFYKATWNYPWQSTAFFCLAQIDCWRGDWRRAVEHLDRSLETNVPNIRAYRLKAAVLRRIGHGEEADEITATAKTLDPFAMVDACRDDPQTYLDFALEFAEAGLWAEGIEILRRKQFAHPMIHYALGWMREQNRDSDAAESYRDAGALPTDYCFPSRLAEIAILEAAQKANPSDAKAYYYLGNLFYDRRRYDEAIEQWERSRELNSNFATVQRNLGLAYFNIQRKPAKAKAHYLKAVAADSDDARLLYELDQLLKRMNDSPESRLKRLESNRHLVDQRDDLSVELATLLNLTGQSEQAIELLHNRRFHPWEGGEGLVLSQHVAGHLILGRRALAEKNATGALAHLQAAEQCPQNLAEARHLLAARAEIDYALGTAHAALKKKSVARASFKRAAASERDFSEMSVQSFSEQTYWKALATRALGQRKQANRILADLLAYAKKQLKAKAKIDYFATSLPNMLLFEDDLQRRNEVASRYLMGLALLGLGKVKAAATEFNRVLKLESCHFGATTVLQQLKKGRK
jgi:tetratricopeptide (TPR) repeat protein